jgi:hypothetical protein
MMRLQTLPIAYYPALSDEDLDKLLADDKPDTVEFLITSARDVKSLNVNSLTDDLPGVRTILFLNVGIGRFGPAYGKILCRWRRSKSPLVIF